MQPKVAIGPDSAPPGSRELPRWAVPEANDRTIAVLKFGGTSVGSLGRLDAVAELIRQYSVDDDVVVVVSAMGGTTDELLALARDAGSNGPCRETDQLVSTGELVSAAALALTLRRRGIPARSLSGAQAGFHVCGPAGEGRILQIDCDAVRDCLGRGEVAVVAGFQGTDDAGSVVTLGRGGSDTTAVALAAALDARECVIFTDVPGVRSADPRVVPHAGQHVRLDGQVMAEMAFAGAGVLHPRSVELANAHGVDILLRSSMEPDSPGTVVVSGSTWAVHDGPVSSTGPLDAPLRSREPDLETAGPVSVAHDADVARVLIHGVGGGDQLMADVLAIFGEASAPIDLVARSGPQEPEFRVGFTMRAEDLPRVRPNIDETVDRYGAMLSVDDAVGKVSLVGHGLSTRPEITARMLLALARAEIPTSWVSMTTMRISAVVERSRLGEVVQLLHTEFGLSSTGPDVAELSSPRIPGPSQTGELEPVEKQLTEELIR